MISSSPLVSVVVPNFNHAPFLEQRLESIYNQTYQNFEVIILDDCSTDNSRSIIEKYRYKANTSSIIYSDKNSGSPFAQWLKGIDQSSGALIWIAESDDFSSIKFLEKVINEFLGQAQPDIVFVGTQNVDQKGNNIERKTRIERQYDPLFSKNFRIEGYRFLPLFLPNYCVIRNASSAIFKKSIVSDKARKSSDFKTIGDYYFWVMACLSNHSFLYISETLNFMRSHPNNVRQSKDKQKYKRQEFAEVHRQVLKARFFDFTVFRILFEFYFKRLIRKI